MSLFSRICSSSSLFSWLLVRHCPPRENGKVAKSQHSLFNGNATSKISDISTSLELKGILDMAARLIPMSVKITKCWKKDKVELFNSEIYVYPLTFLVRFFFRRLLWPSTLERKSGHSLMCCPSSNHSVLEEMLFLNHVLYIRSCVNVLF